MQGSIVCGVDGSAGSEAALAVAAELAEALGAKLVLAHVMEHVPAYTAVGPIAAMPPPAPMSSTITSRGRGSYVRDRRAAWCPTGAARRRRSPC